MMADSNEAALVTEEERPINGISLQKDGPMARAATTADVFNAVAEPRRREIIDLLSGGQEWAVNDVVAKMKIRQPAVSKHLLVLRFASITFVAHLYAMYRIACRVIPAFNLVELSGIEAREAEWNSNTQHWR